MILLKRKKRRREMKMLRIILEVRKRRKMKKARCRRAIASMLVSLKMLRGLKFRIRMAVRKNSLKVIKRSLIRIMNDESECVCVCV